MVWDPTMIRTAIAIATCCLASISMAQTRPLTTALTCAAAADVVNRNGAIVLGTGPTTYDRYVRDGSGCGIGASTSPAFVPAKDRAQCFVGYVCRGRDRNAN